jgi:gluconolactonase
MPDIESIKATDYFFTTDTSGVSAGTIKDLGISGLVFAEGPAADASGNIFFSDVTANKIYKWSTDGQLSTFKTNNGGTNGLFFDKSGNLIACQGTDGKLVSIDSQGNATTLADKYNSVRFNEPNDLWIDPSGGIYFSDPLYFGSTLYQGGQHVYYLKPDRTAVIRVISDMTQPNGLIGTSDGKTLYVADYGAGKTYKYTINADGTLSGKTLFVSSGSDGMTIDSLGNVYLTTGTTVLVYSSSGNLVETITVPLQPTNVCFGGKDGKTLFITAKTAVYSLAMSVKGVSYSVAGDVNGDGDVNLEDAILALKIMSGISLTETINLNSDVNGDNRIGMEEVVYILQVVAVLRQ